MRFDNIPAARVGRYVYFAALALAVLALGSVDPRVLAAVCALFALSVFLLWFRADAFIPRRSASVLLLVAGGLTAFTLLQSVPLPASWVSVLSPHSADVWARSLRPLGEPGPRFHSISVDPAGTRIEVLRGVTYLLVLLATLRVARHREGIRGLDVALILVGVAVALLAALHPALGLQEVYGVLKPKTGVTSIAPLLNSNQLAGYLNVALILAFGSAMAERPVAPRALLIVVVVLLLGVELWLASRGGLASALVGLLLVAALRLTRGQARVRSIPVAVVVVTVLGIGAVSLVTLGMSSYARSEILDLDASKLRVAGGALRGLVPAYPVFGTGRGAFESAFPEFRGGSEFTVFTHPENVIAQWGTEWGLPVASAALAAILWALRPRVALERSTSAVGPWVALVVLALHNLVDFSSETPGIMVAATACAGICVAGLGGRSSWSERWARRPRWVAWAAAALFVLGVGWSLPALNHSLLADRARVQEQLLRASVDVTAVQAEARASMLRHPAEPYFPYAGGLGAQLGKSGSPLPWIGRALERARSYGPAHLVLARTFRGSSRAQARLEYRLAAEQGAGNLFTATEVAPLVQSFDDALELVPEGAAGVATLDALSVAVRDRVPAVALRIDAETAARAPSHPGPSRRAARDALSDLVQGEAAPWCQAEPCGPRAVAAIQRMRGLEPGEVEHAVALARTWILSGDPKKGLGELRAACDTVIRRAACLTSLGELALDQGDAETANAALNDLVRASCVSDGECVENLLGAVALEERRGNTLRALVLLRQVAFRAPDREDVMERLAEVASRSGLHAEAADMFDRLVSYHPDRAALRVRAEDERRLAARARAALPPP